MDNKQKIKLTQREELSLVQKVIQWSNTNSYSYNKEGLKEMAHILQETFTINKESLIAEELPTFSSITDEGIVEEYETAPALHLSIRPEAPYKVLLSIHYDTVHSPSSGFLTVKHDEDFLYGPGCADAKGGIAVIKGAVELFEQQKNRQIGITILLTPDEEIGSLASDSLLRKLAKSHHAALVYEPSLPNGQLAGSRKGSGNFYIIVKGKSAHAGRSPHLGRNAINAVSEALLQVSSLHEIRHGTTVNVGKIYGGGPLNVVPDHAYCGFNIRVEHHEDQKFIETKLNEIIQVMNKKNGISATLHGSFNSPPKPMTQNQRELFNLVKECGSQLGENLSWKHTGGVCDGNRIAAEGTPVVDTLGVEGKYIHSPQEYCIISSIARRVHLSHLILEKLEQNFYHKES